MRSRRFLHCRHGADVQRRDVCSLARKTPSWMDEPFTKWDQKQVAELYNNSAWAVAKSFRGQATGKHGTTTDIGGRATNGAVTGHWRRHVGHGCSRIQFHGEVFIRPAHP